jgi:hypothetical protein
LDGKVWSHSDCVGNPKEFLCRLCVRFAKEINTDGSDVSDGGSDASDDVDAISEAATSK